VLKEKLRILEAKGVGYLWKKFLKSLEKKARELAGQPKPPTKSDGTANS